jgi:predicted HAD superfamily Cof-like phosphohydrolase
MSDITNGFLVTDWMIKVGQAAPKSYTRPNYATVSLRQNLITEEYKEVENALLQYRIALVDNYGETGAAVALVKELCDLLVVTYGTLTALGIDADEAFAIVMKENYGKVAHAEDRGDGKIVVAPEVKEALKLATKQWLTKLIESEP